jgi:transposase
MSHPTVTATPAPNLVADTICRTVELGLSIDNAADAGNITHLYCHPGARTPDGGHGDLIQDTSRSLPELRAS